jgi:predicted nucleic acid-binding protein
VIVVDTNIICYRWMPSPHSEAADTLWQRDPDWIAPLLWRSEFRNALAGALRQRVITLEAALEIAALAEAQMEGHEFLVTSAAVLSLVARSSCSAYDCEFVALAQQQKVPLLTVDRQLLRAFPATTISLEKFTRG